MTVHTLVIDGLDVAGDSDQTILDVARENSIHIPTLCHLKGLSDIGACRLCVVEVAGSAKLFAACVTNIAEGMTVVTDSPRLQRVPPHDNRNALHGAQPRLLGVRGQQPLRAAAPGQAARPDPLRPAAARARGRRSTPRHERFVIDHNRCILCTRCVRVCDEIEGAHTWDVLDRGAGCRVITDMGDPWGSPRPPARAAASASRCARPGALFEKGRSVAEAKPRRRFIPYLMELGSRTPNDTKRSLATVWLDGCSGCHMSFLDMDERLLDIAGRANLVYSPLVDAKEFPASVDVTLVEGAVSSEDDLREDQAGALAHPHPGVARRLRGDLQRPRHAQPLSDPSRSCSGPTSRTSTVNAQLPGPLVPELLAQSRPVHKIVDGGRIRARMPALRRPDLLGGRRTARRQDAQTQPTKSRFGT